jgi:hypothetical protein
MFCSFPTFAKGMRYARLRDGQLGCGWRMLLGHYIEVGDFSERSY